MVGRRLRYFFSRLAPPRPRPLILAYHRAACDPIDPWGLAVSPVHFAEHLQILRRTRYPMSMTDFADALRAETILPNAIAVTFDDGYQDNLSAAKPRLEEVDVPATLFVATGYLDRREGFWWDQLAEIILCSDFSGAFEILVRGNKIRFELNGAPPLVTTGTWRALQTTSPGSRQAAYVSIWQILRSLRAVEREAIMIRLRRDFGTPLQKFESRSALTSEEIKMLARDGLIEIGAHTITHPPLSEMSRDDLKDEICGSKSSCEILLGASVKTFSYPFGDFNSAVRAVVKDAGFDSACSTIHAPVAPTSDVLALPRFHVFDWDGDRFERELHMASIAG
jgi:peptidoglycan/xylan/chitin deacetylase (PgdA/CDA1 family)